LVNLELDSIQCTWLQIMLRLCQSTMMINSKSSDGILVYSFMVELWHLLSFVCD
jgi:hypothetical protein